MQIRCKNPACHHTHPLFEVSTTIVVDNDGEIVGSDVPSEEQVQLAVKANAVICAHCKGHHIEVE